jgi:hypothetical protein
MDLSDTHPIYTVNCKLTVNKACVVKHAQNEEEDAINRPESFLWCKKITAFPQGF